MWQFAQLTTLQPQQVYVNGAPLHVPQAALRMPYPTSVLTTMSGIRYTTAAIQVFGLRQLNTTVICCFKWCIWRASVCTTWILTVGLCNVYATTMAVIGVEWLLVQNGLGCTWLD